MVIYDGDNGLGGTSIGGLVLTLQELNGARRESHADKDDGKRDKSRKPEKKARSQRARATP